MRFVRAQSQSRDPDWNFSLLRCGPRARSCPGFSFGPQRPKNKMTSERPSSVVERRLSIARRLFNALVAALPDRVITLHDGQGREIASSKPDPDVEDNSA